MIMQFDLYFLKKIKLTNQKKKKEKRKKKKEKEIRLPYLEKRKKRREKNPT
jgi:hypothetical protein